MYSLLLMTAVAGGPDASGFGWHGGGCYGSCYGGGCSGYYSGCTGYSCSGYSCSGYASCCGCSGYSSCNGCHGGLFHGGCHGGLFGGGCHGGLFHGHGSCHGCWGSSCYGSGYGSCYGSGCWGSCYGSGYGVGCWGSCYSSGMGYCGCTGGVAVPVAPAAPAPAAPAPAAPAPMKSGEAPKTSLAPARLTVELPATAKLYVDGSPVAGTGATRQFHTPDLAPGGAYFYDLTAEVEVNGKVETEAKRVIVRAGEAVTASFDNLVAAASAGTAVASK